VPAHTRIPRVHSSCRGKPIDVYTECRRGHGCSGRRPAADRRRDGDQRRTVGPPRSFLQRRRGHRLWRGAPAPFRAAEYDGAVVLGRLCRSGLSAARLPGRRPHVDAGASANPSTHRHGSTQRPRHYDHPVCMHGAPVAGTVAVRVCCVQCAAWPTEFGTLYTQSRWKVQQVVLVVDRPRVTIPGASFNPQRQGILPSNSRALFSLAALLKASTTLRLDADRRAAPRVARCSRVCMRGVTCCVVSRVWSLPSYGRCRSWRTAPPAMAGRTSWLHAPALASATTPAAATRATSPLSALTAPTPVRAHQPHLSLAPCTVISTQNRRLVLSKDLFNVRWMHHGRSTYPGFRSTCSCRPYVLTYVSMVGLLINNGSQSGNCDCMHPSHLVLHTGAGAIYVLALKVQECQANLYMFKHRIVRLHDSHQNSPRMCIHARFSAVLSRH